MAVNKGRGKGKKMRKKVKVRVRKREVTTLERQSVWNEYYCSFNFGLGIECTKCKKWRFVFDYKEPHQVPEDFECSDAHIDDQRGSCDIPSCITEDNFGPDKYTPGSVVWAKFSSYPWWPGIVEDNPDMEEYTWLDKNQLMYHVTFFGDKVSYAWVKEPKITPFVYRPKFTISKKYKKKLEVAIEQAERAHAMDIQERLRHFSLAVLYKGKWPKADDFGTDVPDIPNGLILMKEKSWATIDADDKMKVEAGKNCEFHKKLPSGNGSDVMGLSDGPLQEEHGSSCDATISSNINNKSKDLTIPCPNSQGSVEDSMSEEESMEIVASEQNTLPPGFSGSSDTNSQADNFSALFEKTWHHPIHDYGGTRSDGSGGSSSYEEGYSVFMQNRIHTDPCSDVSSGEEDAFQVPSTHNEVFNSASENDGSTHSNEGLDNISPDPDSASVEGASTDNANSGGKFILGELSLNWNDPNFRLYVYNK